MKSISDATKANWKKLNVTEKVLEKRANKRMSSKKIVPVELFCNKENIKKIENLLKKLEDKISIYTLKEIMYNLSLSYLISNGLIDKELNTTKKFLVELLQEYSELRRDDELLQIDLPNDEIDILGIIYQCLMTEGDKNEAGSYYTPNCVVQNMTAGIKVEENAKILDPCCGTGMFLLGIETSVPESIYGVDIDEIAVMIAKINLIVKYKSNDFRPNIYRFDFIRDKDNELSNMKFDFIITNPPWGANLDDINKKEYKEVMSGESFSYVLYNAIKMSANGGKIIFLLPESFLNVKVHSDIRKFVIENVSFEKIIKYPSSFSGVVTKYISIYLKNTNEKASRISIYDFKNNYFETISDVLSNPNFVITFNQEIDKSILEKVFKKEYETLKNSTWALGIVTGNNKEKLKSYKADGMEEIYTGKEITDYSLLPCKNFIKYDRAEFQQVAPDRIYRSEEKLVYKFISKKITFAYDNKKSLFLNSANILIPNLKGMSIKTAMAFLNSKLFQYLYIQKFGEIKILKGNLSQLPLPVLTIKENLEFEEMVDKILSGSNEYKEKIEKKIYELYQITDEEINHIGVSVNGKID